MNRSRVDVQPDIGRATTNPIAIDIDRSLTDVSVERFMYVSMNS
jgi:hypothetical protein